MENRSVRGFEVHYSAGVMAVCLVLFALGAALGLVLITLVATLLGEAVLDFGSPWSPQVCCGVAIFFVVPTPLHRLLS